MTTEEILNSGKLYKVWGLTNDAGEYYRYLQMMEEYNAAGYTPEGEKKKQKILKELFAEVGEGSYLQAPYHAMWGGQISPKLRAEGYGCNEPVYIGKNVWIASNVTILPGVHIGDNSVIGAGAVVTKDIPANVLAVGTPAKVLREIGPEDDIYYMHGKLISENMVP